MWLKKTVSVLVAIFLSNLICIQPVFADMQQITYDSTVDESATTQQSVKVEVERAELYTVTLPKSVILDGTKDVPDFTYEVSVLGEIGSLHYIRVIPLNGAVVTDGVSELDLTINQNKRRFNASECLSGTVTQGVMQVENMLPGLYQGVVTFLVSLDDGGFYRQATCTLPKQCLGYDINDDGILQDDEKLETPVTIGKALGHKIADDCTVFPAVCERCGETVYEIHTAQQLVAFRDSVNVGDVYTAVTVTLCADIDMLGEEPWTMGIGTYDCPFVGDFDGNNFSIKNITINNTYGQTETENDYIGGLFSCVKGSDIKNLKIVNPKFRYTIFNSAESTSTIIGKFGTLIGCAKNCGSNIVNLTNVHINSGYFEVVDTVRTASTYIAGLIGYTETLSDNYDNYIRNCSVTTHSLIANMPSAKVYCGGFFGNVAGSEYLTASNTYVYNSICAPTVSVTVAGGVVGYLCADTGWTNASGIYSKHVFVTNTLLRTDYSQTNNTSANKLTETNNLKGDTATLQTQAAVDILNTDNDEYVWILDLENINGGYPVCKYVA